MKKLFAIIYIALLLSCAFSDKRNNSKFKQEQIDQLKLEDIKPLQIEESNVKALLFNNLD